MNCSDFNEHLDDFVDRTLGEAELASASAHVASCERCASKVAEAGRLQTMLRDYGEVTMPTASTSFYDEALVKAARAGGRKQRSRWMMTGFGSAIAAGLAVWVISAMFMTTPNVPDNAIPAVTMALEEPRTVNLVFSSATDLENATLTVSLPTGVEIAGFAGQRELTWMTSLKEGKNVLPLTLIATSPLGGELMANVEARGRRPDFPPQGVRDLRSFVSTKQRME